MRFAFGRVALLTIAGLLVVMAVVEFVVGLEQLDWAAQLGNDRAIYVSATQRWLAGGGFYLPHQLQGVYQISLGDVLYPPTVLLVLVPLSVLPAVLWWAIPLGYLAWQAWSWRPAAWALPLMAAGLAFPHTPQMIAAANPSMWIAAAFAAGLRHGGPGALVLLKPSLLPFALAGIRTRAWWILAGLMAIGSLALLPLFPDWFHAVSDGRGWGGLLYSISDVPFVLIPLWAWLGRARSGLPGAALPEPRRTT